MWWHKSVVVWKLSKLQGGGFDIVLSASLIIWVCWSIILKSELVCLNNYVSWVFSVGSLSIVSLPSSIPHNVFSYPSLSFPLCLLPSLLLALPTPTPPLSLSSSSLPLCASILSLPLVLCPFSLLCPATDVHFLRQLGQWGWVGAEQVVSLGMCACCTFSKDITADLLLSCISGRSLKGAC